MNFMKQVQLQVQINIVLLNISECATASEKFDHKTAILSKWSQQRAFVIFPP